MIWQLEMETKDSTKDKYVTDLPYQERGLTAELNKDESFQNGFTAATDYLDSRRDNNTIQVSHQQEGSLRLIPILVCGPTPHGWYGNFDTI